jgi:UDP-N-acetylenolpyruvoylglucosamine reductase
MPMIHPPHVQPAYSYVAYVCPHQSQMAEGREGQAIDERIRRILKDLRERSGSSSMTDEALEFGYRHVPFQSAGTIRVRFQEAVPMMPRQFVFEHEDE